MSILAIQARRRFAGITIEADFATGPGVTALFGPSGSGKTTVVNMLAGLERPDTGRIEVEGRVLFDSSAGINVSPEHRRVGYVFQQDRLFPHLSVRGNLRYGMRLVPKARRWIAFDPVVELLGIGKLLNRRPATLSGGEKQRVAIGRALLASPSLLLMDEPLASLDNARRSEILPFLNRLRSEVKLPIVYVSHNVDEILNLADTLVVLGDGRCRATGPVEEVLSRKDIRPWTGTHDAGSVFTATVAGMTGDGLTALQFRGGILRIPEHPMTGSKVRVRVSARDVSIALECPQRISVLNIFQGIVISIEEDGAQVDVCLDIGIPLWARITRHSAAKLGLSEGSQAFALVKAVAVDRESHNPTESAN